MAADTVYNYSYLSTNIFWLIAENLTTGVTEWIPLG